MSTAAATEQLVSPYKSLSQEQIDEFHLRGYIAYGKLLDDPLIEVLRAEYDRLFAEARQTGRFRNLSIGDTEDLDKKNNADEQMLQIMQMCERSLDFRQLLYDERILDIAEDLIGPNIQLFHDQALYKPPHYGGSVFWHQDNAYWQCIPASLVSCWLTLDDVNVENGAMHLMPGSHLTPLGHDRTKKGGSLLDIGDQIDQTQASVVDLPAGGVLFHHCQTLHYTPPNNTDRQRRAFAIHFMPPGTRQAATGDCLQVSYGRPMLRMHS
ncbi:MAG: phytanoyl-CoA dioxygenase family protein [Candidatus Latescibacterota bacterium]|nr:phytanoyl-CoA dioxygenase family protein [Candidatus Latescibacterota bacterium]